MRKSLGLVVLVTLALIMQSCKKDIVKQNFLFADQQLEYALMLADSVVKNDNRDAATKARNPFEIGRAHV